MNSESVQLRHPRPEGGDNGEHLPQPRRSRPKSASYVALRSAVYQLTSLADFKLEKIGAGFFADVFKVQHKSTGEVMVLKMNKNSKTSRAMLTEIQLMNRLSHPNILKFKGSCVHEGHLHALTEYINSGSLEELLMDKTVKLSWGVRLKIIKDIVQGMVYLHSRNVFHRDLNPKNCLIQRERDGRLRLVVADFGLAAKIKQKRRRNHTEAVGSPYWMAPELLKGKSYCEQADVFSFGITLAEIMARISADPDFMPRTQKFGLDVDAMRPMCEEGCPEELFELLDKCCQIDPDDRPTFEEISHILDSIPIPVDAEGLEGNPESLTPPPPPPPPDKDLRSCISEPFIRLEDPPTDDDSRSCGSEGESRVIVHNHSRRRLLGSLGSSTSSSCGSRADSIDVNGVHPLETESITISDGDVVSDTSDAPVDTSDATDTSDLVSNPIEPSLEVENKVLSKNVTKYLHRRCSLRENSSLLAPSNTHKALQKSRSLNVDLEEDRKAVLSRQFPVTSASSVQTLVPEDEVAACNTVGDRDPGIDTRKVGRGGDSGIDPGDIEVFRFSPSATSNSKGPAHYEYTAMSAEEHGDNTPICTSPDLHSAKYSIPITKSAAAVNRSPNQPPGSPDQETRSHEHGAGLSGSFEGDRDGFISPAFRRFSFSGASSDELIEYDYQNFVTPTGRCMSPMAQSWTSSECSFSLPTPSTPWAPPCSPLPITLHSLPTSPSHYTQTSSTRHHRRSHDVTNTTHPASCMKQPRSCRNSALFPDTAKQDGEGSDARKHLGMEDEFSRRLSIKSVHFLDVEDSEDTMKWLCSNEAETAMGSNLRPRSKSNPHTTFGKVGSAGYPATGSDQRSRPVSEYSIRLKQDPAGDPHSCKGYKIAQKSNTRLSSSTPDLSKLAIPTLQGAPSM